ncbi:MAG: hypothetical protein K6E33_05150 [Lachnospiraceae bacterium]|nr:hypothetical protein [Lachnospiraceae bacterium]
MERNNNFLRKQYMRFLFPVMLSIMGGTINTLIDSAFLSVRLGADAMASVNLAMPAYLVLCTLGSLFGSGSSILASRALGRENALEANDNLHKGLFGCIVTGAFLTLLGMTCSQGIAGVLAQNGEFTSNVQAYIFWLFAGSIPSMAIYFPVYFLQLEARIKETNVMTAVTLISNLVLDYLFLYTIPMGPAGAALATSLSMLLACSYGFTMLFIRKGNFDFDPKKLNLKGSLLLIRTGSPMAVGNLVDAVRMFALNSLILKYLGGSSVAVWTVLNAVSELSMMITSGVPQTAAMMTGLYYSAKENGSIRILTKLQVQVGSVLLLAFSAVVLVLNYPIKLLYSLEDNVALPLFFLCVSLFPDLINSILARHFSITEHIRLSHVITFLRRLFCPVYFCASMIFSGGDVWLFLPLGNFFAVVVIWLVTGYISGKSPDDSHKLSRYLLLDDYLEKEHKILDFSVKADDQEICEAAERIREFCEINDANVKLTVRLGMAIEELLVILKGRIKDESGFDLRAFMSDNVIGVRIRSTGDDFNPFSPEYEDDEDMMGVKMIEKLAVDVTQSHALGMNTIHIFFES